jgi:hypothetical protein
MGTSELEVKKPTPTEWLQKRQPKIVEALDALRKVKTFSIDKSPVEDLNQLHTSLAGSRNYQEWVKSYLVEAIGMELEVKRLLAVTKMDYKDQLGKAFTEKAEIVSLGKSFEEKILRLREHLPIIREQEEWEQLLDNVQSIKEAVQFVYDDLSKGAMAIASHINVVKTQILTGQVKIQIDGATAKVLFADTTLDAIDKAAIKNSGRGETSFEKL